MIRKIEKIQNMALFQDYDASQDPPGEVIFQPLTLIYGNNGSGKSTLAAFFKTLHHTTYIPLSLPVLHYPHADQYAKIILDTPSGDTSSEYIANEWSHQPKEVKVFDEDYLNGNTLLFQANKAKSGFHMDPRHSSIAGERSRSGIHLIRATQIATWCFNVPEPNAVEIRRLIERQQRIPYDFFIQYQQNTQNIENTFSALLDKPFGFEINNPIDRQHWMTLVNNSTHVNEDDLKQVQDAYDQNHNTIISKIQQMFERVNVSLGCYRLVINKYLREFATGLQITRLELKTQAVIRKYRRRGWDRLKFDFNVYSPIKHYYEGEFVQCCITLRGQPLTDLYLSEADKRAFAMSIFFANLVEQQNDQEQIVVMDDPVTSLDANRKSKTLHFIINLFERQLVKQVIVLSHNADALRDLWKLAQKKKIETSKLQINKNHTNHTSLVSATWTSTT
ncbi:hypothetical protein I4U23_016676 [Adineta vaga]|nr:hypothetical protein I4U23_016676 [Adineta vaga]